MAIEILQHGDEKFVATCHRCGCKFTYEVEDIDAYGEVHCPECIGKALHCLALNRIYGDTDEQAD